MQDHFQLEATAVRYLSQGDEDAFFNWLNTVPSISRLIGRGPTLFVSLDLASLTSAELRELVAIFFRYDIDLAQIKPLSELECGAWLLDPDAYWYPSMFRN